MGPQRQVSPELEAALWGQLTKTARLMLAKLDCGVVLVAPGYGRKAVKRPSDVGTAVLTGAPGELTLAVSGRARAAAIHLSGPEDATAHVSSAL